MVEVAEDLHSLAIRLLRGVRRQDRFSGLSAARLSALSVIVYKGPLKIGELAEEEQVTAPTMTRLTRGLEKEGLIRKRPDSSDGRIVRVAATPKGRRLLEESRRRRIESLADALAGLSDSELDQLKRAGRLLRRLLSDWP